MLYNESLNDFFLGLNFFILTIIATYTTSSTYNTTTYTTYSYLPAEKLNITY